MIRQAIKYARTAGTFGPALVCSRPTIRSQSMHLANDVIISSSKGNPVALQMINYALTLARSHKSDNFKGLVLLAISTLLSESGNFEEAVEKLGKIQDLSHTSMGVRVTATEALTGLHLELGLLLKNGDGYGSEVLMARAKALKGLVALVDGDALTADSIYQGTQSDSCCAEAVLFSATCALGQLNAPMGNFTGAEEILTRALTKTEEHFGPHHPKVGVVLTCIALMFRQKAMQEH